MRDTRKYLSVGVDPPQGWAIWGYEGFMGWGQGLVGRRTQDAWYDRRMEFEQFDKGVFGDIQRWIRCATELRVRLQELKDRGYAPAVATVEHPYGVGRDNVKAMMANATATGWWYRELQHLKCVVWGPMSVTWRRNIGFRVNDRTVGKVLSRRAMDDVVEITGAPPIRGPEGGEFEHANEAMCIAMSAWIRYRFEDGNDVASEWLRRRGIVDLEQLHRDAKKLPWAAGTARKAPWIYTENEETHGKKRKRHSREGGAPEGASRRGPVDLRNVFAINGEVFAEGAADHRAAPGPGGGGGGGNTRGEGVGCGVRDDDPADPGEE